MLDADLLRSIFDQVHDGLAVLRADGTVVTANDRLLELHGLTRDEVLGSNAWAGLLCGESGTARVDQAREQALAGEPQVFQWVGRRPHTEERFPVEASLKLLAGDDEPLLLFSVRDISDRDAAFAELERYQRRFRDVALASSDWIWETDNTGVFRYVSERVVDYLGYTPEELLGTSPYDLIPEAMRREFEETTTRLTDAREPLVNQVGPFVAKDGSIGYSRTNAVPSFAADGTYLGYLGVVKDVTGEHHDELRLRLFERLYDEALEGITVTDTDGNIVAVNASFTRITGYTAEEALGKNPRILRSEHHDDAFYAAMWSSLVERGQWQGEIWNRRKSGEVYPEWLSISSIDDTAGRRTHYVAIFHDISDMKEQERQIRHQALHDALTGLPNRTLLMDRLEVAVQHARRTKTKVAVLFVDLDGFKNVNDTLGHSAGDELLRQVVVRFQTVVRQEDTLSRQGGDEFVVVIRDTMAERIGISVAQRLLDVLREPFYVRGSELFISSSIGISIFPNDGAEPETLVKNADLAMYRAKASGRSRYTLFTAELNQRVSRRVGLESQLRRAIEHDEFVAVVQPQIRGGDLGLSGVEMLVRWRQSDGTLASPGEFIEVAEETSLVVPIDRIMLRHACRLRPELVRITGEDVTVSVNISAHQLRQLDLATVVAGIIGGSGVDPAGIELEVTETAMMTDLDRARRNLEELAELGVRIAVDDFGTGYSSLSYLKRLPIDTLKIDQSFVADIPGETDDEQIVATISAMAQGLRLSTIAEGVETTQQLEFLRLHGVDHYQGYLFSKPLAPPDFEAWYRQYRSSLDGAS